MEKKNDGKLLEELTAPYSCNGIKMIKSPFKPHGNIDVQVIIFYGTY